MMFSAGASQSMNASLMGASTANGPLGMIFPGTNSVSAGTSQGVRVSGAWLHDGERHARERGALGTGQPGIGCLRATPSVDLHKIIGGAHAHPR